MSEAIELPGDPRYDTTVVWRCPLCDYRVNRAKRAMTTLSAADVAAAEDRAVGRLSTAHYAEAHPGEQAERT